MFAARITQGVVQTVYGEILLKRGGEAFDALKQGMRDIEFLATSGAGDVWVGCAEALLHGLLPAVIRRLAQQHPNIIVHATDVNVSENIHYLQEHKRDLMIGRAALSKRDDDLRAETLFEDSVYRYGAEGRPIKAPPVDRAPKLPWAIYTRKNRTLCPVVKQFIETTREAAREMAKRA
jgi:DNA-binding transcriptional LysR family regulator